MPDWTRATALAESIADAWADGPGGAFVLFNRDGIRAAACGGLASLEHAIPFTADTPSRYASISKHFLATTLLLEGIDLDAKLGTLLPGLHPALGAVPLALERRFGRILIPASITPDWHQAWGTHPATDALLSTTRTRVDDDGVPVASSDAVERPGRTDDAGVRAALLRLAAATAGPRQPRHPDDHDGVPVGGCGGALRLTGLGLGDDDPRDDVGK